MNEYTLNLVLDTCQGNLGAISVMSALYEKYGIEIEVFLLQMKVTSSQAPNVWLVYKDLCREDIEKTWQELTSWFEDSEESLGAFMAKKHPSLARDFSYYA